MNASDPNSINVIPGFAGTFAEVVGIIWVATYLNIASAALVTFDAFLTLEQEIRLVWRGRWGIPSVLYILIRYGSVVQAALNIVGQVDYKLTGDACLAWALLSSWSIPVVMMLVEAMLALRVAALYLNNRLVVAVLFVGWLGAATAMLALMGLSVAGVTPVPSSAPPTLGCNINSSSSPAAPYWTLWLPSLIFETTAALLTLARALVHRDIIMNTPLLLVLVRDGFLYFFVIFALMLANLVICLTTNELYYSWMGQPSISIAACMVVRLFLNLRQTAKAPGKEYSDNTTTPIELSSLGIPTAETLASVTDG